MSALPGASRTRIDFVLRLLVGGVLLIAAVSKIANPNRFLSAIFAYDMPLPDLALRVIAVSLPWLELLCGIFLIARIWIDAARLWAVILFGIFLIATGQAWARGLDISCGCMNLEAVGLTRISRIIESPAGAFVKNLTLAAAALFIQIRNPSQSGDKHIS